VNRRRSPERDLPAPTAPQRVEARGKGHSKRGGNRGRTTLVIHNTATKRQRAWTETAQPTTTLRLTRELDELFDELRDERKGNPGEPFKGRTWGSR
jgi:hypothetical protein